MSDDHLTITSQRTGTTACITASGEIDIATAPRLREHTRRQLDGYAEIVVLDLAGISFIDGTGLHVLLDAARQERARLRILPSPACLRLFEITGVRDQLPLIDTETPPA